MYYYYFDKNVYTGDFINGMYHGKGKFSYPNGSCYEGDFENDKQTGKGTLVQANGDVYVGDFVRGKFHGYGKFTWKNGNTFEGKFRNNKRSNGKLAHNQKAGNNTSAKILRLKKFKKCGKRLRMVRRR